MDLQEITLGLRSLKKFAEYHPHHVTYAPENFEAAMSNGSGERHLQENTLFDIDLKVKVT